MVQSFELERDERGLRIKGFDHAVAFVALDDTPQVRRFRHLLLHRYDLTLAHDWLMQLVNVEHDDVLRQALWHASLVHFYKCFSASADRVTLSPGKIYGTTCDKWGPRDAFDLYKRLRNRHVVHDENGFSQALAGAIVGPEGGPNVLQVAATVMTAQTADRESFINLGQLVMMAIEYVEGQVDEIGAALEAELNAAPRATVLARPEVTYTAPGVDDI